MTKYDIFDTTEDMTAQDPDGTKPKIGAEKYPWRSLPVGKSFAINTNIDTVKLTTIQSSCSKWSKKLERKFLCKELTDKAGVVWIQVARLADSVEVKAEIVSEEKGKYF